MMSKNYWIYKFLAVGLILIFLDFKAKGQILIGLTENQEIKKASVEQVSRKKSTAAAMSQTLPFFEDFSDITVYPDPDKWTDIMAFINSSFPDLPPSIGVATLDAIDATGNVYAIDDQGTPSDTLTSVAFNLLPYKNTTTQVILSFYYQAGGKGELPDPRDSLVLEFYSPVINEWLWEWKTSGDAAGPFQQVIRTIPQSLYEDGFRFRFRNYTSMSPNEVKGKHGALSNVDQWHIDYIRLDTNPRANHESVIDVAFVEPLTDLLFDYTTVPWHHLNEAQRIGRNKVRYVIRNLEQGNTEIPIHRSYYVKNVLTKEISYYVVYTDTVKPASLWIRNDPFDHSFSQSSTDYGRFEVTAYFNTNASQYRGNDTVKYDQLFSNYYAYDDGTAEFGFGISGESTTGAMLACRFPIFKQDTIRGLDIFFNKTRNHFTIDKKFNLCIWKNEGGKPGDTLYVSEEFSPSDTTELLEFSKIRIPLTREILVDDTVFVGIKQLSEDFLNIGYDVSHDNRKNILVNITGSWFSVDSLDPAGSLMIRPVFSTRDMPAGISDEPSDKKALTVFPNPASDRLFIALSETMIEEDGNIMIYDITGRQVSTHALRNDIDVDHLKSGIYILKIVLQSGQVLTSKVIISR